MARKANIAREEIIMACWSLLEQNFFPNIPRLTDFFLKQDGRKCSNTTFLKAITEWEELYKERQDASFDDLSHVFMPSFKKFERDITRDLQSLLEETLHSEDNAHALKRDATVGQYLSLSSLVEQQENQIETQSKLINELIEGKRINDEKNLYLEKRYQETLSTLRTQQIKSEERDSLLKELNLNLVQKELDQTKLELKLALVDEERLRLLEQQTLQFNQINTLTNEANRADVSLLTEQVKNLIMLQKQDTTPKDR